MLFRSYFLGCLFLYPKTHGVSAVPTRQSGLKGVCGRKGQPYLREGFPGEISLCKLNLLDGWLVDSMYWKGDADVW
ncbi:hypothetical protein EDB82DRAFT_501061 [Fusarium venenatum]|uniref:uncharacterized protein n=1 Tax=Fusarium venenatum TaxID=56646 RepID=UPI001DE861D9|nr:hypothetical protein EDB82DRAFT_501061 [Fusarium venenatum]